MLLELRARGVDELERCLRLRTASVQSLGWGDEWCARRIPCPKSLAELRTTIERAGLNFRLVFPRLSESAIDAACEALRVCAEQGREFSLTSNDIGLLAAGKNQGILPTHVALGRLIARSMADCPWVEQVVPRDEPHLYSYQNAMCDKDKAQIFSELGVTELELNPLMGEERFLPSLHKQWGRLLVHSGASFVTTSRACPLRKQHATPPGEECAHLCTRALTLRLNEICNGQRYCEASPELRQRYSFEMLGNTLFERRPPVLPESSHISCVVLNAWEYPEDSSFVAAMHRLGGCTP